MNKLAFVFPGQGSQTIGMCADLARHNSLVQETFALASAELGYDLWQRVQAGPEEALNRTEVTQPALLSASYAIWQLWCAKQGRRPDVVAGHSLGEYAALVCAGVLDFTAAVSLVQQRGRLMQQAVPAGQGGMAAIIGLDEAAVDQICDQAAADGAVSAANFNAPGQVVIAGTAAAVERACAGARSRGAKMAKPLDVSVPAHCVLMQPAAEAFAEVLEALPFKPPAIPIIQNTDADVNSDPDIIRKTLLEQLYRPVRWRQSVLKMAGMGVTQSVECGPGRVLTGLGRRISKAINHHALNDAATLEQTLRAVAA